MWCTACLAEQELMAEDRRDVMAAVHDVQNQHHVTLHDAVEDDVIASRKAAHTRSQIVTASSNVWFNPCQSSDADVVGDAALTY